MKKGVKLSNIVLRDIKENVEKIVLDRYADGMIEAGVGDDSGEEPIFDVTILIENITVDLALYVEELLKKI